MGKLLVRAATCKNGLQALTAADHQRHRHRHRLLTRHRKRGAQAPLLAPSAPPALDWNCQTAGATLDPININQVCQANFGNATAAWMEDDTHGQSWVCIPTGTTGTASSSEGVVTVSRHRPRVPVRGRERHRLRD
jgi:hypothetical protein